MNLENNNLAFLAYFICVTSIGLFGNTIGVISTFRSKFKSIGPLLIFRCLFIADSLSAVILTEYFFFKSVGFQFRILSRFACKFYAYTVYQSNSIPSMMHAYIILERFLSMKYPVESNFLRKKFIQKIFILAWIGFSLLFYLPVFFIHDIVTIQKEENQTKYNITSCHSDSISIGLFFGFVNRLLLPIVFTILFSFLLICKMISARSRVYLLYSPREIKIFHNDIKLSLISIISNSFSIVLNLPLILAAFVFKYSSISYFYAYNIYYLSSFLNFYTYLIAYLFLGENLFNSNSQTQPNNLFRENLLNKRYRNETRFTERQINRQINRYKANEKSTEAELQSISRIVLELEIGSELELEPIQKSHSNKQNTARQELELETFPRQEPEQKIELKSIQELNLERVPA